MIVVFQLLQGLVRQCRDGDTHIPIASNVSEVPSKASVGLFEKLVARFDTQLLLHVKFVPVVVDPVVFVDGKAV
jgi:hypothetical protein